MEQLIRTETEDELKNIGTVEEIRRCIEQEIEPFRVETNAYAEICKAINFLKQNWNRFQNEKYFQNENAKYIFALIHMEGEERNKIIELTDDLYDDQIKENAWKKKIIKKIHPDNNPDKVQDAEEALNRFKQITRRIEKCFKNEVN